jgi:TonB-linked SusC/RagA family outer membrane protein
MSRTLSYTFENLLTYDLKWNDHSFNAMTGYEVNQLDYYYTTAERRNFENDVIRYLSAGSLIYNANDIAYANSLISILGRVNYNYKGKYMASASYRRDGSSRFGPDKKWGDFPSFSAGWRVSEEEFMSDIKPISNLKLKASYGFTGNNNFADYAWISQMTRQKVALGSSLTTSLYPSSVENPDLGWERTKLLNVGFELGLLDNRISFEADIYKSTSDGLLLNVPVPSTSGFSSVFTNTGELENRGIELNLSTHNLTGELKWTSQFTFSANRNKITKLGIDDAPMIFSPGESMQAINMVGESIFSFYGYIYEGSFLNQAEIDAAPAYPYVVKPGMGKYKDVSGDGKVNADDRTIIGNNQPGFAVSMNNQFRYKNFDFSFLWQGLIGNDVYDAQFRRSMIGNQGGRNYLNMKNDRWRSEADPGDGYHFKLTTEVKGHDVQPSTYWIVDGTYFRLKDVSLGYTLPKDITKKMGIGNARIYFNGINMLTIQKSHLIDAENFGDGAGTTTPTNAFARGVSHNPYPTAKVYSFGINVEF